MPFRTICCLILILLPWIASFAQNPVIGHYAQRDYRSVDYSMSPQNWSITSDSLGRIWVANSTGVLYFDGTAWNLVQGTVNRDMYHLARTERGWLYGGGRDEIGYFAPDARGAPEFRSFAASDTSVLGSFGQIESMLAVGDTLYFKTAERVYRIAEEDAEGWDLPSGKNPLLIMEGRALLPDGSGRMFTLGAHGPEPARIAALPASLVPVAIYSVGPGRYLYFGREPEIYLLEDGKFSRTDRIATEGSRKIEVTAVTATADGRYAVSSKGGGLLFAGRDGRWTESITTARGLPSNTCYSVFSDPRGHLWTGLDNGLAQVEYPVYLSAYNHERNGLEGVVLSVLNSGEYLYAGTTAGLFYLRPGAEQVFRRMSGIREAWDVRELEGLLLCASSSGLYRINGDRAERLAAQSAHVLAASNRSGHIWIGLQKGVGYLQRAGSSWTFRGPLAGPVHEVRFLAQESDTVLWASYEEISRLVLEPSLTELHTCHTFGPAELPSEKIWTMEAGRLAGEVRFGTPAGLYRYDRETRRFQADSLLGPRFTDGKREVLALAEDDAGGVWFTSSRSNGRMRLEGSAAPQWDSLALTRLRNTDVWRIVPGADGAVWFCATDGLYRFLPSAQPDFSRPYRALISRVEVNRDTVVAFSGRASAGPGLPFSRNNLRFHFSAASYHSGADLQFSFWLEGNDRDWSAWTPDRIKEYTNLHEGDYVFHVRARDLYGMVSADDRFAFRIEPPAYRSWWAYGLYALALGGAIFVVDRVQRRRLLKKREAKIIAQQKELERERAISESLRRIDRLKDEFLAHTSHELRTPLNGIIGISESLFEQFRNLPPAEVRSNLSMVIASGKRLASMVDSILDYSKLKTHNLQLNRKPVDLQSCAGIVLSMLRPLTAGAPVELRNSIPDDLPWAEGDENRIQQILYNLVGNAVKYTEKGFVEVEAGLADGMLEVRVRDSGTGIPADKIDRIFTAYEQLENNEGREYVGTGLGLAITRQLVELHGGSIGVESVPGEGSTFTFTLPASEATPARVKPEDREAQDAKMAPSVVGKRGDADFSILIVDDEAVNRQVLLNHLRTGPFHLQEASGGQEALEMLEKQTFDLVLLDVMMPRMSGYEVCAALRKKHMMTELPVIFLTAKDQLHDLVEGFSYGANDYLSKPFSRQELMARVMTQLNLHLINKSYSRFVPHEFIYSLGRESILDVRLGDQVEKTVTILFADIRGYTTLAENMTARENFEFLNAYLSMVVPAVYEHSGFILQYFGDGLMALFPGKPEEAVMAAVAMMRQVHQFNEAQKQPIQVGMGLHTGHLVLGILGDLQHMDINVVSDSVNTASRMEGLTKHYGAPLIVSEDTLNGIGQNGTFQHRYLGLVRVKGKSHPMQIYEILDGLPEEEYRLKVETRPLLESGLKSFYEKSFTRAAVDLKQVTTLHSADICAERYLRLAARYIVEGVPDDWDGVENMESK